MTAAERREREEVARAPARGEGGDAARLGRVQEICVRRRRTAAPLQQRTGELGWYGNDSGRFFERTAATAGFYQIYPKLGAHKPELTKALWSVQLSHLRGDTLLTQTIRTPFLPDTRSYCSSSVLFWTK